MTLISIGGVAIGVWALTVVLSVMNGFEGDLKARILGQNAHGMLMKAGAERVHRVAAGARPGALGPRRGRRHPLPLQRGDDLLRGSGSPARCVKGIDPATIGTVTDLPASIERGGKLDWLSTPELIPASPLRDARRAARRAAGCPASWWGGRWPARCASTSATRSTSSRPFGDLGPGGPQPKSRPFRVAAIFYSGMYEYDAKFAYLDLDEAQRFFGTGDGVTGLELKVSDVDRARPILSRVAAALGGYPYRTKDWGELNRNLFSALQHGEAGDGGDPRLHRAGGQLHHRGHPDHAGAGEDPRDRGPQVDGGRDPLGHEDLRHRGDDHRRGRHLLRAGAGLRHLPAGRPTSASRSTRRSTTSTTCRSGSTRRSG